VPVRRLPPPPGCARRAPADGRGLVDKDERSKAMLQPTFWDAPPSIVAHGYARRPHLPELGACVCDLLAPAALALPVLLTPSGFSQVQSPHESDFGLADWQIRARAYDSPIALSEFSHRDDGSPHSVDDSEFGIAEWQLQAALLKEPPTPLGRLPPVPVHCSCGDSASVSTASTPSSVASRPLHAPPDGSGGGRDSHSAVCPSRPTSLPPAAAAVKAWMRKASRMAEAADAIGAKGVAWALLWHAFSVWRGDRLRRAVRALPPVPRGKSGSVAPRNAEDYHLKLRPLQPPHEGELAHRAKARLWQNRAAMMEEAVARGGIRCAAWALKWDVFRLWHASFRPVKGQRRAHVAE